MIEHSVVRTKKINRESTAKLRQTWQQLSTSTYLEKTAKQQVSRPHCYSPHVPEIAF